MSSPALPAREFRARYLLPEWDDTTDPAEVAWRHGYIWCRHGRFDRGWAWWDTIEDDRLAARVHAGRAATLRQFGLHEQAQIQDEAGLAIVDDWVERAALLLGYTADAVGHGNLAATAARFQHAGESLAGLPDGLPTQRQHLRFGWVAAEVQLLTGHGDAAPLLPTVDEHGQVIAPPVYQAGSAYHLAKGLLFAGVLGSDLRTLDVAARLAPDSLGWAVHLARHALGAAHAEDHARAAWRAVVPPDAVASLVLTTATHLRLAG